jgi:hypothetical protein
MWMPATTFSSVIEIFDEGGFARKLDGTGKEQAPAELNDSRFSADWFVFSTLLGHHYYPIHHDRVFEKPEKRVTTPGFDTVSIHVTMRTDLDN